MTRTLTDREMARHMTRLELRQAAEVAGAVRAYLPGHEPAEVAERTGLPVTLVRKLQSDDPGRLWDVILWQRRQEASGNGKQA
jgi:hypothetical protein